MDKIESEIDEKKLTLDCQGGGRIQVDPATRTISVYGQSQVRDLFYRLKRILFCIF
jgi:hypothetical protein